MPSDNSSYFTENPESLDFKSKRPGHYNAVGSSNCIFLWFFRRNYDHRQGPTTDLAWGNVTIDNSSSLQMLQIYLKRLKTDQAGKGAHIYIDKKQIVNYVQCQLPWHTWQVEGLSQVHSSSSRMVHHLLRQNFLHQSKWLFQEIGLPLHELCWSQFQNRSCHRCSKGRTRGLDNP